MKTLCLTLMALLLIAACAKKDDTPEAASRKEIPFAGGNNNNTDKTTTVPPPPGPTGSLFGTWISIDPIEKDAEAQYYLQIKVSATHVEETRICQYSDGKTLQATAKSSATITSTSIDLNDTDSQVEGTGSRLCRSEISPVRIIYRVDHDSMTAVFGGTQDFTSMDFKRVQ